MKQLVPVGIALLLVSAPVFADCSAAEKKALEEWDRAWGEAARTGNRAALQQIYAEDYAGLNPAASQTKSQAIEGAVQGAEAARRNPNPPPTPTFDHYIITCTPNAAVITHRNTIRTTVDGREQTTYSRSVHILEKRGGKWQVISDVGHALNEAAVLGFMEREWANAIMNKDRVWLERNLASNYTSVHPMTGGLMNKSDDIAEMISMDVSSVDLSDVNTRVEGDSAVVTGVAHVRGKDKQGKPFDARIRFTDVFIKRDGRWQALSSQATMIPAGP